MVCSGKKSSLTRRDEMESHTSFSWAHSRTWWVPFLPKTMDRLVPQAPAPMTAISLMCASIGSGTRYEKGSGCDEDQHLGSNAVRLEHPGENREHSYSENGSERHVTEYKKDHDED